MTKSLLSTFLVLIMLSGLALGVNVNFGVVQVSADAPGVIVIIGSDTTWTKADSPHTLTGPLLVREGVTLTIEAGATVYLKKYYMLVNGTLVARGSSTDKIHFNGGNISFTGYSNGWNEQTGSGCIIENAVLSSTSIFSSNSLKIIHCSITASVSVERSSIVSGNTITGDVYVKGSTILSNNIITGKVNAHDSSVVSANTIAGGVYATGLSLISNNSITGTGSSEDYGVVCSGDASVSKNVISGWKTGVGIYSEFGWGDGYPLIEKNLIANNTNGIAISILIRSWFSTNIPTIKNNTISHNSVGIKLSHVNQEPSWNVPLPTIINNNIQDNSDYNFYLDETDINIDVSYNWWGTTDTQTINLTIYDYKYDFDLGKVNFIPFLTEPNPEATPIPEFPSWTSMLLLLILLTVGIAIYKRRLLTQTPIN